MSGCFVFHICSLNFFAMAAKLNQILSTFKEVFFYEDLKNFSLLIYLLIFFYN